MSTKLDQLRLYNQVGEIDRIKTIGFSLISIVLPPGADAKLAEINALLAEDKVIISEEHDVFEKVYYKTSGYLNADVSLLMTKEKLKQLGRIPKNGWVFYVGFWKTEDGKVHSFSAAIEPFAPISASRALFIADYRFHTEALHDLLEASSGPAYGIVIFDYTGMLFVKLQGNRMIPLQRVSMQIPRFRSSMHTESALLGKVVGLVDEMFVFPKTKQLNVEGLILAGNAGLHKKLYEVLPKNVKDKVIKVVDVEGVEEEAQSQVLDYVEKELGHVRLVQELLLLKKFYAAKAASRDKVALGAKETMAAIENKTAQTVIVYDDLRVNRVAGGGRVVYWEESTPRTEVEELGKDVEEENLLHWLLLNASKVTASGATIELVSKNSRLGVEFWRQPGIAAIKKSP